ncbi:salivary C-type lectin [Culex quinquefasciatus]|uniref:Salivary C-type lectin n=1 Tax=Culex quinquefasciatus TaxID=7176 RepID=B0WIE0_CULQU|nr:salivary C-type lectin [Culex quinquefasciatus]|eukprot:XP_001848474.1 salivary C-type lectin [Culex quinquefasciatus]
MSFQTVSSALVLSLVALASSSSATKNSTSDISSRAGFANSYQRYFVYNDDPVTFFEAWHRCRAHGLRLASVHSALDNVKLMAALAQKDINQRGPWWIAGTDLGRTGNFVWITSNKRIDGRSGYTNFAAGEEKSACANEHCLVAGDGTGGTQWDSVSCDNRNGYICELDTCDC